LATRGRGKLIVFISAITKASSFWFSKQMAGNGKASTNKKVGNQIPRGRARSEGQGWRSIGGTNKFVPFPVLF